MKKVIKLSENELRNIIREAIGEVKYGGVSLHGNDMGDWDTMEKVRRSKGGKDTTPHWKRHRNFDNKQDVFRKNFGEYETNIPGQYRFPDEETYNKADDAITQAVEKGFDKSNEININTVPQEIDVFHEWYDNNIPFYVKKWQGNGYYPIKKYENYKEIFPDFEDMVNYFTRMGNAIISKEPLTNPKVYDGEDNRVFDIFSWYEYQKKNNTAKGEDTLGEAISRALRKYL